MNQTIITARVTFVFRGYGDLTLTDAALVWNKSATSFLMFGVLNAMTDNHVMIPLDEIAEVGKYTYFPGGGLAITKKDGEKLKFSFKKKREFKVIYEYLTEHIRNN